MSGWPDSRFAALLGSRLPIVAAPMAGAAGVDLAVAAIEGGAVGSLPCGLLTAAEALEQAAAVKTRCRGPLNLNFFCHEMPGGVDDSAWRALLAPLYEEQGVEPMAGSGRLRLPFDAAMCAMVEEARPALVSFHFGLPAEDLLERVKRTGARIVGNATTIAEAAGWRRGAWTRSLPRVGRPAAMPAISWALRRRSKWAYSRCCRRSSTQSTYR